jgi:hypothetical protein
MLRKTYRTYPTRPAPKAKAIVQRPDGLFKGLMFAVPTSTAIWYGLFRLVMWLW